MQGDCCRTGKESRAALRLQLPPNPWATMPSQDEDIVDTGDSRRFICKCR